MRYSLLILLMLSVGTVSAQTDSIRVTEDREDGIYLTYDDFRKNIFINKEKIISNERKSKLDFLAITMSADNFTYQAANANMKTPTKDVWGFLQNRTLYINYKGEFFRVPVFGAICYFVATVSVLNAGFYDPMFGYGVNSSRSKEIREFIFNFYDGNICDFTLEKAEELLSKDKVIFAEFKSLNKRNRNEQVNRYIRRFNVSHPVYFLK